MDPDTCWENIVKNAEVLQESEGRDWGPDGMADYAFENVRSLVEHTLALVEWLKKGGFPPKAFEKK